MEGENNFLRESFFDRLTNAGEGKSQKQGKTQVVPFPGYFISKEADKESG